MSKLFTLLAACLLLSYPAIADEKADYQQALTSPREPDSKTPGVFRTDIAESTACTTKWGKDERIVTETMKVDAYAKIGIVVPKVGGRYVFPHYTVDGKQRSLYEVDHKYSRELLGKDDPDNLWAQSYVGDCNAHNKDRLENRLNREVCKNKTITLPQARAELDHWVAAYEKRFGSCKVK